jgi:hypothetical protein
MMAPQQQYPMFVIPNTNSGPVDYQNMTSEMGRRLGFQYMATVPQPCPPVQNYQDMSNAVGHSRVDEVQKVKRKIQPRKPRHKDDREFVPAVVSPRQSKQTGQSGAVVRGHVAKCELEFNSADRDAQKACDLRKNVERCMELNSRFGVADFFAIDEAWT